MLGLPDHIRACLFDLDGVLTDTASVHRQAWKAMFDDYLRARSDDTGEEFDSSWNRGESIEFPLRGLIQGWQDGIPGMKVGGRRQLTIPPAQAYGPAGGGHRLSGKTLIFVIDLLATR